MSHRRIIGRLFAFAISLVAFVEADQACGAEPITLRGHRAAVADLEFAPDGASLASISRDGETVLWDLKARTARRASGIARDLSPGERYLCYTNESPPTLLAGCNSHGMVIDPASAKSIAEWGDRAKVNANEIVYAGGRHVVIRETVFEPGNPSPVFSIADGRGTETSAVSPDGKRWCTNSRIPAGDGKRVQILDAATGEVQCDLKTFTSNVLNVAWTDSSHVLVLLDGGSYGGSLMLWDVSGAGKLLAKIDLAGGGRLAVSADGRFAAVALREPKVALLSIGPKQLKVERTVDATLNSFASSNFQLSRDGQRLLTGAPSDPRQQLVVFDTASGSVLLTKSHRTDGHQPELSPDGQWVAQGHADGTISLIPVGSADAQKADGRLTQILDLPLEQPIPTDLRPGAPKMPEGLRNLYRPFLGAIEVAASGEAFVLQQEKRFSFATTKPAPKHLPVWKASSLSLGLAELPTWALLNDGTFLVEGEIVGYYEVPRFFSGLVNPATGEFVLQKNFRSVGITAMRASPDGSQIAVRGAEWSFENGERVEAPAKLILLDSATGKVVRTLAEGLESATPCRLAFSNTGKRLAVLERWKLRVFETESGDELPLAGDWRSTLFWFLNEGKVLARQEGNGEIVGVDLDTQGEAVRWNPKNGQNGTPTAVAISGDGKIAAVGGSTGDLTLRDPRSGAVLHRAKPFELAVGAVGFSPDGSLLAAADADRRLIVWKVGDAKAVAVEEPGSKGGEITLAAPSAP